MRPKENSPNNGPTVRALGTKTPSFVLVDFAGKAETDRPDFYILTADDWIGFVEKEIQDRPDKKIILDSDNCPIWTTQVKGGNPYRGIGVEVKNVVQHKEAWGKITDALK